MNRLLTLAMVGVGLAFAPLYACLPAADSGDGGADAGLIDASYPSFDAGTPPGTDASVTPDATVGPDASAPPDAGPVEASVSDAGVDAQDAALPLIDAGSPNVRFANMVPDLPTAIDVCAAPQGLPLQGPFLKAAGVTAGLAYGQLTQYVTVPIVPEVVVRVVAANSTSCATGLLPDFDLAVTAMPQATVALVGSTSDAGSHAPQIVAFPDDPPSGFPGTGARVRIIHAAPFAPATDFEIGGGPTYVFEQQLAVPFGAATSTATMATGSYAADANGYFVVPYYSAQISAVEGSDVASFAPESSGVTVFLAGIAGSPVTPLETIMCDDTASPSNFLQPCLVHAGPPMMTTLRIANFSAVLPAIDYCVQFTDGPTTAFGPVLQTAGLDAGVGADQISSRVSGAYGTIPTDTAFNFILVPAGQPCTDEIGNLPQQYPYGLYEGQSSALIDTAVGILDYPGGGNIFDAQQIILVAGAAGAASLEFTTYDVALDDPSFPPLYDVYATASDGGVTTLGTGLVNTNGFKTALAPGTYTFQVDPYDGGAPYYDRSGIVFGADQTYAMWFFDTSTTAKTVERCDLGSLDASVPGITDCLQ